MSDPLRTIHVALTDGERVWLDESGDLPHFVQDVRVPGPGATAVASRLLTDAVHVAPVVVIDDTTRLHVLVPRDAEPDRGGWAGMDALSEDLRDRVGRAVREHLGTPPAERPQWYRPGWHAGAEEWIDEQLRRSGRVRTGTMATHRVWSISAVYSVPTDAGDVWFKVCCDHFAGEAPIVDLLARRLPGLGLDVIGTDAQRAWLLTEPLAGVDAAEDADPSVVVSVLGPAWAAAQMASLDWLPELRSAGAPDRTLEPTLRAWREAVRTSPEVASLTEDERAALAACTPAVEAALREFWACGFPDTLGHGDLHVGNVAWDGTDVRIFDWTDGCITHPFLDGTHLAMWRSGRDDADASAEVAAVLEPWRQAFPDGDFERAVALAPLADDVFQTVTFDGIARTSEPGLGDFDGVVAMLTRTVVEWVSAEDG